MVISWISEIFAEAKYAFKMPSQHPLEVKFVAHPKNDENRPLYLSS